MTIGWYVHHHGAGHRTRMAAVRPHLDDVVVLSSLPGGADDAWVHLAADDDGEPRDVTAGGTLHWDGRRYQVRASLTGGTASMSAPGGAQIATRNGRMHHLI